MRFSSKEEVRKYVWNILKSRGVCLFPCDKHIPNFVGAHKTIERILELEEYKKAKRIFVSPDTPQRLLIKFALGKKEIYMAAPKLRNGFCKVVSFGNLREILRNSKVIGWNIPKIDLALVGSVAVDLKGNRIGKGGGFGDREIQLLREANPKVIIATNVHDLQVFEDLSYLMEPHDQKVNLIVTPAKIIKVS